MRATVIYAAGDVRVEDVPDARLIEPRDALVRVTRAAICGSDLWPYKSMPHDDTGRRMGHEFIGIVEAVGSDVATLKPGDLVLSPFLWSDGSATSAAKGCRASACTEEGTARDVDGGQGEAVRVPQADGTLVVLPVGADDELMPSLLTLSDVMGTGHHAALAAKVGPGKTVAVIGDGAVGLCAVIAAKRLGAERIILLGNNPERVALGQEFGATDVVRERGEEAVERIRELTAARRAFRARVRRPRAGRRDRARDRPSRRRDRPGRRAGARRDLERRAFFKNASMAGGIAPGARLHRRADAGRARRPDRTRSRLRPHRVDRGGAGRLSGDERPRGHQVPDHILGGTLTTTSIPILTLNNGVEMPAFGLGVFQSPPEETTSAVEAAIGNGYPLVDAAAAYGNEREVGEAIRRSGIDRSQIFIVTKLWISDYGHDEALVGFDGCLRRLGLDYVDLFLLHHPVPTDFDRTVAAYEAIEEMLAAGRTRAIGVSNFMEDHLGDLLSQVEVVPAVNQIEAHPYFSQPELRSLMAKRGISTQAWSPIGGVYAYGPKNTSVLEDPVVVELAAKYSKTPAQVVLRWHIENGFCAIPKSVKPHRIAENIDIFDFQLARDEVAAIDALDSGVRGGPDPARISPATYPYKVDNE